MWIVEEKCMRKACGWAWFVEYLYLCPRRTSVAEGCRCTLLAGGGACKRPDAALEQSQHTTEYGKKAESEKKEEGKGAVYEASTGKEEKATY